jgi:hypothetical protein
MSWIILFWTGIICLLIYEIYAITTSWKGDTISEMIWEISLRKPIIPFAFGFLMGHFFWSK